MKIPSQENYVFWQGEKFQVEFYFNLKGEMPAKDYFEQASNMARQKLFALVVTIAEKGKLYDLKKYRIVSKKEKIYEFKVSKGRYFNFFYKDRRIIMTNAYTKKSQKINERELKKAIRMKQDYELRRKEETYYDS